MLIVCEAGSEKDIKEAIRGISNVRDVDIVYGEYDLVAKMEVNDIKQLDGVVSEIRHVKGVLRTMTLLCD